MAPSSLPLPSVAMAEGTDVLLAGAAGAETNPASSNSEEEAAAAATCCLCMEPWTSCGDHRICCLPCGHMYGRFCLEKWLCLYGPRSANCPQCGKTYGRKDIVNLWKECCHRKEIEEWKLSFADYITQICNPQWQKMKERFEKVLNDQAAPLKALRKQVQALRKQMVKTKEQGAPSTDCYGRHPSRKRKSHANDVLFAGEVPKAAGTGLIKTNPAISSSEEEVAAAAMADQGTSLEALMNQVEELRLWEQGEPATDCNCRHRPHKRRQPAIDALFIEEVPRATGTGVTKTNPAFACSEEEVVATAEGDGDCVGYLQRPPASTCCVCMQSLTSNGDHRICCIPCGHVYGRCCLEKWLCPCGGQSAKCPRCGQTYGHKDIINLCSTKHLWNDNCCHKGEIEEFKFSLFERIIMIGVKQWWRMQKRFEKVLDDQEASLEALRKQVEALRLRSREQTVKTKEQGAPATDCYDEHPRNSRPPATALLFAGEVPQAVGTGVTKRNPAFSSSKEEAGAAATAKGDSMEYSLGPSASTCRVCMQRWTSKEHRICTLPCGHVYGRCCLEEWFCPCGEHSMKCPQCGQTYGHKDIISLCSTKHVWIDDCRHKEENEEFKLSLVDRIIKIGERHWCRMHKRFEKVLNDQAASVEALREQVEALRLRLREGAYGEDGARGTSNRLLLQASSS